MTRRALVLAGGGVRGAFQVGMIRQLTKNLDFQIIRGVSVGAINGAFLAQAPAAGDALGAMQAQASALEQVWHQIGAILGPLTRRARTADPGTQGTNPRAPPAVQNAAPSGDSATEPDPFVQMAKMGAAIKELIDQAIDPEKLLASKRDFTAGYVSLLSGQYMEARPADTNIRTLVRASAALPPLFPCVDIESDILVDGGYRNITPLASAFKASEAPDEIYVLLTRKINAPDGRLADCSIEAQPLKPDWFARKSDPKKLYPQVATRLIEILMDEVYLEDVKRAIQENSLARVLDELEARDFSSSTHTLGEIYDREIHRRPKYVKLYVLAPQRQFDPDAPEGQRDGIAAFDADLIRNAIEHGAGVAADKNKWLWHPGREKSPTVAAKGDLVGLP